ncbi:MAG: GGDEF domain-containing protein [Planctomycetota bacterium]
MTNPLPSYLDVVNADNLPSPPTLATEILRLTRDDGVGLSDIADVIARDPALTAKFLKLANSSLFPSGSTVTSLDQAMMRLGLKTVKLMALSFSLVGNQRGGGLDFDELWRRSLAQAVAARQLAKHVGLRLGEEAFLCGILGRIGQLALNHVAPEAYAGVVSSARDSFPSAAEERAVLGFDHHAVGGALLDRWELPDMIVQAVRHSGAPSAAGPDTDPIAVAIAKLEKVGRAATRVLFDQDKGSGLKALHDAAREFFGLGESEIESFLVELEENVSDTARMLEVDLGEVANYDGIVAAARQQMVQISIGAAMDLEKSTARAQRLEREKDELDRLAHTDKLTGLHNRSAFDRWMENEVAKARRHPGECLGVLVMDIDHFKRFNDTHGHLVGDEVLKTVGRALAQTVARPNLPARYGGEEFVVVIPEAKLEELERVAEAVRVAVESTLVRAEGKELSVTISIGGALARSVDSAEKAAALVKAADELLYEAKEAGRNRCVCRDRAESLAS